MAKLTFPAFPEIEGWPCKDEDYFWGYACAGHVALVDFRDECIKQHGVEHGYKDRAAKYFPLWPSMAHPDEFPCHAFVYYRGFGGWQFCFPDAKGARPITYWPGDSCGYEPWLMQMLKDHCRSERVNDELALKLVHTLQQWDGGWFRPARTIIMAEKFPPKHPAQNTAPTGKETI